MRRAGDFPESEPVTVGLTSREVREDAEDVRLALHHEHRDARVIPDVVRDLRGAPACVSPSDWRRVQRGRIPSLDRRTGTGAALQQERVEHCVTRVDRVDVGREVERRLRRTRRRSLFDGQAMLIVQERAQRPSDLGEDVERESVAGMQQRRVPIGSV